ncbi:hypothetical protein BC567DRAFT_261352 [Phyllosticta citribraziliensis]
MPGECECPELQDGPQDGLQNTEQQQQQHMQAQYAQLQAPQEQVVPGVVPVNSMANFQLLHAAENAQGPDNPYNMPPQLPYQHHHHHQAPAVGQLPLGHAAPDPALAAPPPPPPPSTPAQLAPITAEHAQKVKDIKGWGKRPLDGPPPHWATEGLPPPPMGTFVRAYTALEATTRGNKIVRCGERAISHRRCHAHFSWPCARCVARGLDCEFGTIPTHYVPVRIDPAGFNLDCGYVVREVGGRLENPPHKLLTHLKEQQKDNPAY